MTRYPTPSNGDILGALAVAVNICLVYVLPAARPHLSPPPSAAADSRPQRRRNSPAGSSGSRSEESRQGDRDGYGQSRLEDGEDWALVHAGRGEGDDCQQDAAVGCTDHGFQSGGQDSGGSGHRSVPESDLARDLQGELRDDSGNDPRDGGLSFRPQA